MILDRHIQWILFLLMCASLNAFEGFYIGGSLGGRLTEAKQSGSSSAFTPINFYSINLPQEMFTHRVQGALFAGYGMSWSSLYLALEGSTQFSAAMLHSSQSGVTFNTTIPSQVLVSSNMDAHISNPQYALDLLPGWVINPTVLLYGRIGLSYVKISYIAHDLTSGMTWNLPQTLQKTKHSTALRAGLGLEQRLTQKLFLRTDYIFTDYDKLHLNGSIADSSTVFLTNSHSIHLYDHALMLGLVYRYSCLTDPLFCDNGLCTYHGGYFGGAIGGGILEANLQGNEAGTELDTGRIGQTVNSPSQLYNNQFQGMFFLGYGTYWKKIYLGAEAIASATTHSSLKGMGKTTFFSPPNSTVFLSNDACLTTSSWQWGVDLRPGALLTFNTLLYGRVGVAASKIKAQSDALTFGQIPSTVSWNLSKKSSKESHKATFRIGFGVEQLLTSKLHFRLDYIHTRYGNISFNDTTTGVDTLGESVILTNTLSTRLQDNTITLGLSYYFR